MSNHKLFKTIPALCSNGSKKGEVSERLSEIQKSSWWSIQYRGRKILRTTILNGRTHGKGALEQNAEKTDIEKITRREISRKMLLG
jgi:hypothetical protein